MAHPTCWQNWRHVHIIDPPEQKVVIAVREAACLPEEFLSSCLVKLSSHFRSQGHVSDHVIRLPRIVYPVLILQAADTLLGPMVTTLNLDYVEFVFKP
jgi:hypothetical protein